MSVFQGHVLSSGHILLGIGLNCDPRKLLISFRNNEEKKLLISIELENELLKLFLNNIKRFWGLYDRLNV